MPSGLLPVFPLQKLLLLLPLSLPWLRPTRAGRTIEKRNTMRLRSDAYGFTGSSSSETDDGFFSSEEEKEESTTTTTTTTFFSSYSSEFYASAKKSKKVAVRRGSKRREAAAAYWPAGGCKGGGKKKEKKKKKKKQQREVLVAVEKLSRDPYKDFRRSMVEMTIQRQMFFRPQDLENLLHTVVFGSQSLSPASSHPAGLLRHLGAPVSSLITRSSLLVAVF